MNYYFTFGFGQLHENGFHKIEANSMEEARAEMVSKFGLKWAFAYTEDRWFNKDGVSQQEEFNLKEIK